MITKKITFDDIKSYLYSEKNPYMISHAASTSNYISIYINKTQRITVFQKGNNIYEYEFQEEVLENKDEDEKIKCNTNAQWLKHFTKVVINYFLDFIFTLFLATLVFKLLIYAPISLELVAIISFLISILLICAYYLALEFIIPCKIIKKDFDFKTASNHSAEHMVINFIQKNYQLPSNLSELRLASRFDRYCSSYRYLHQDSLAHIASYFVTYVLCLLLIFMDFPILFNIFIFLIFGFIKDKICSPIIECLSTLGSYIIQYKVSTTKNVSDESLITAYIAANMWFHITHYNEYDENNYRTFFKSANITVTDIHERM